MAEKLTDEIRARLAPGFADMPRGPTVVDDRKECAFIGLRGASERLEMVLKYRSEQNYEAAVQAVERAMAEYRSVVSTPGESNA